MPDLADYYSQPQTNFFSSLAVLKHSLATPISNLLINLELISQDPFLNKLKPNSDLYLQRSLLSAKYLQQIMTQCQPQPQKIIHHFSVKNSLLEVIEICRNPQQKGVLIPFMQLNSKEKLAGNKLYFQEAVICLLNNAFQAYEKNAANKLVLLFAKQLNNKLILKITDKGRGFLCLRDSANAKMPSKKITSKGTGLSFIEHTFTSHFQGKIEFESELGKGTTVHCSLPLSKQ